MATDTRRYYRPSSFPRPSSYPRVLPTYILPLHPLLADVFQQTWWWTCACWEVCGTLVTIELLTEESLERFSLIILACHNLQILMEQVLPEFSDGHAGPAQPIIPIVWLWAAPILMSFAIGIIVSSPYWWRPHREETMVMVAALIALFFLEALLPVVIFMSTAMLLMRQVGWFSGLAVIGSVWALLTFLTHLLRCAVYQNLGGRAGERQ